MPRVRVPAFAAAAGPAVLAAGWSLPGLAPFSPGLARRLGIATRSAAPGTVALTFDDGPHPRGTPAVLDALAAAGVTATFFLMGERVRAAPALAAEVVAAGHAVALHGDRHRGLLRLPPPAIGADLDRARAAIQDATGADPVLHRAPYGVYSWPALTAVRARGWLPVLWSRWGRDWTARATPASVAREVAAGVRSGDVLLLHDADDYSAAGCWRAAAGAIPAVADAIASAGLRPVALRGPGDLAPARAAQAPGR
jgi:peptidoglycan-N-acetylglucosamine deacetylase